MSGVSLNRRSKDGSGLIWADSGQSALVSELRQSCRSTLLLKFYSWWLEVGKAALMQDQLLPELT